MQRYSYAKNTASPKQKFKVNEKVGLKKTKQLRFKIVHLQ